MFTPGKSIPMDHMLADMNFNCCAMAAAGTDTSKKDRVLVDESIRIC